MNCYLMNDTPAEILRKQSEIILSKPLEGRLKGLFEMTDLSRKMIQNSIKSRNPDISEIDLKIETFKIFYRQDFDNLSLNQIVSSMQLYLTKSKNASGT